MRHAARFDNVQAARKFGVGADISKNDRFDYFKDLIAQGFLAQSDGQFPTIALTEVVRRCLNASGTGT